MAGEQQTLNGGLLYSGVSAAAAAAAIVSAGLSPLRSENGSVLYGVGRVTVSIYLVLSFDICSAGNDARGSLLTRRCCLYVLLMCAEQLVCQGRPAVADPLS